MDRRVVAWGDEDDDDYLPPRQETPVDLRGIKTVTEYKHDADGNKVKVVTKVKVFTEAMRINKKCFERKRWAKFGAAANCEDNNSFTIKSFEDIAMETPQQSKEADEQPSNISDGLQQAMERVRRRNALRVAGVLESAGDDAPPMDDDGPGGEGGGRTGGGGGMGGLRQGGAAAGKYVPPSLRQGGAGTDGGGGAPGGGGGGGGGGNFDDRDNAKIRVTNISEDTSEADLRELFQRFGKIYRIYLAKDQETMQSRGFAFVSFAMRSDAEKAMEALQGYGYDHLILKLEWAKPSNRDMSGGGGGGGLGGLSGMRVSGYGQALAQDTKQKVSFASNLTR